MEPSCDMGHPQRAAQSTHDEDPLISIQDWFDDEETGPWCVDNGSGISVMRTRAIYDAVSCGELSPDMKVWRDGRACWLPIAECYELTVKPPPERHPTPVSGVRRVHRAMVSTIPNAPSWHAEEANEREKAARAPRTPAHPTLMLTTSFAIGVVLGALLYLPFAW